MYHPYNSGAKADALTRARLATLTALSIALDLEPTLHPE